MIRRWHHPSHGAHILGIVQGLAEIADGIVTLLSLGFFSSSFELTVSYNRAKYLIKSYKEKKKKIKLQI